MFWGGPLKSTEADAVHHANSQRGGQAASGAALMLAQDAGQQQLIDTDAEAEVYKMIQSALPPEMHGW